MMFWFNRHRRLRDQLSAYIDGQLTAAETEALERHLATCVGCRQTLEELRATVLVLRDIPLEAAPRSFALRPEQVTTRGRPRSAPTSPVLATGMRLAGAAAAFALAAVLLVDFGDLRGDSGGSAVPQAPQAEMAAPGQESERAGVADTVDEAELGAFAEGTPLAGAGAPVPAPVAGEENGGEAAPVQPSPAVTQQKEATEPGGGLDPLRTAEVALAAALALLVVGSLTLAFARRKV